MNDLAASPTHHQPLLPTGSVTTIVTVILRQPRGFGHRLLGRCCNAGACRFGDRSPNFTVRSFIEVNPCLTPLGDIGCMVRSVTLVEYRGLVEGIRRNTQQGLLH
jgi:hypothetical protein